MALRLINRGDIWLINLDPTLGHEQSGIRPALIISDDLLNQSLAELVIVLPITSKNKGISSHVEIHSDFLPTISYITTEDIRSVSVERLIKRIGSVDSFVLQKVKYHLSNLLGFTLTDTD
jgi:mRNA interferase MazF